MIKFFPSVFCSANLSCFMIFLMFKGKHKVAGDIISLNLPVTLQITSYFEVRGYLQNNTHVTINL